MLSHFKNVHEADLHLSWLMIISAEHGTSVCGIKCATILVILIILLGQLLGIMNVFHVAVGIVSITFAVFIPHGAYALAVLFGLLCLLTPYTNQTRMHNASMSRDNNENAETFLEAALSTGIDAADECPPKFCF